MNTNAKNHIKKNDKVLVIKGKLAGAEGIVTDDYSKSLWTRKDVEVLYKYPGKFKTYIRDINKSSLTKIAPKPARV